ncbi:unnamed protein product [Darwinula stevensoni]|uniref:Methyltransferase domain-containing protein n=1 Tax=Darwinula stevensoni TaxID=69355 RepID=A0A7R8X4W9_9CRUS|nr:unnamed protein product [Darwinula stevensoni]CAG0884015.1 unnamed protein product [Darwinula stevensoni]
MADTTSTNTSVDDRTEGENPTRDLLADGIVNMLKPTVDQIEERIKFTRIRQVELHQHIETLLIDLQRISEAQPAPLDFEEYVKKLTNTKRRVMVINNILHNAQFEGFGNCKGAGLLHRLHLSLLHLDDEVEMETPHFDHLCQERYSSVYEPAEDSFLLLDALEQDLGVINSTMPLICLEVGCGSGVVISALGRCLETPALCLGVDINPVACHCTQITAQKNGSNVDVICADLAILLLGRLESSIDVLIFNPPYVVTESAEVLEPGLPRSWADILTNDQFSLNNESRVSPGFKKHQYSSQLLMKDR